MPRCGSTPSCVKPGQTDHAEKFATDFVLMTLKKRLFSSPAAFAATLARHENTLKNAKRRTAAPKPSHGVLQRQIDRMEEEYSIDDEAEEAATDAVDTASLLFNELTTEEAALLKKMKTWADHAAARLDAKAKKLIQLAPRNTSGPAASGRTSGSSSSPSTAPRRTGSIRSWRPRG